MTFAAPAALALLLAASPARAGNLISFNPGNGVINGINSFNYVAGDVVADGLATPTVGATYTVYYQSKLGSATGPGLNIGSTSTGFNGTTSEFDVVAGFGEKITGITAQAGAGSGRNGLGSSGSTDATDAANIALGFNAAGANFFKIYAAPNGTGNFQTGAGFGTGTLILSGHIVADGFSGTFLEDGKISGATFTPHTELLNQSGAPSGQPETTRTVTGSGGTNLRVVVDSYSTAFFPTPPTILSLDFTTTNSLPFTGVQPSAVIAGVTATPGATNGVTGPDLMFQSVAQNSFNTAVAPIPEPSSVVLAASSIVLTAGFFFRKRQKQS